VRVLREYLPAEVKATRPRILRLRGQDDSTLTPE